MAGTRMYVKGLTRSAFTARKLIALSGPTARALAQTIEILGETRDIFSFSDDIGPVVCVRSTISPLRYLQVFFYEDGVTCSCDEKDCLHARKAKRYLKTQETQKYYTDAESQIACNAESALFHSGNTGFSSLM